MGFNLAFQGLRLQNF